MDIIQRLLDLAIQIQQIPAPTFEEARRADFVRSLFANEGLEDVSVDSIGNVFARLKGKGQGKPLIVCAHVDTVFPMGTNLQTRQDAEKIFGPGLGDNSLGVAALLGLSWLLRARKIALQGDLWLVADVCEEGLGDLRGILAVAERFGVGVQGYLIIEGLALGHVYHRAVGVKRYRVTARTAGGHSWSDYGQPSAVHELSKLVTLLTALQLPSEPRTTMNVGKIAGGTSVNVIASEASMELDLRSEGGQALVDLVSAADRLIHAANQSGISVEAEVIGQRPTGELAASHPFVRLAEDCLRELGLDSHITSGSTDANIPLSRGIPAIVLGVSKGGGAHTMHEFIQTAPIAQGMEQLVSFVSRVWD